VASVLIFGPANALPKEAPIYRSIETRRKREMPPHKLPKFYGRHPNPTKPERLPLEVPGGVQKPTKREAALRAKLNHGEKPAKEDLEKVIQVFANRARQELRWLAVQRREFIRRGKRWAGEMLLQELEPGTPTVQVLLLGCAATGDVSGAEWWVRWLGRNARPVGRLEYNCVIAAHGTEGQPREAERWLERMRVAGFAPDARSFAGVVEAWERVGNRKRMLQVLLQMQEAEGGGQLGAPLDPRDAALPYHALARSYTKVADAPRALSVLKHLQAGPSPLTHETHKLRLEAHLRTPGRRRSCEEVERALRDAVGARPGSGPLFHGRLAAMCRNTIGDGRFEEILAELGTSEEELVPDLPGPDASERWRVASIQAAMKGPSTGKGAIQKKNDDERWFRRRIKARKGAKMGEIQGGYRMPGTQGMPEWMTLPVPVRYGY